MNLAGFASAVRSLAFKPGLDSAQPLVLGCGMESGQLELVVVDVVQRTHRVAWSADRCSMHAAAVRRLRWQVQPGAGCLLASCGDDHMVRIFSSACHQTRT